MRGNDGQRALRRDLDGVEASEVDGITLEIGKDDDSGSVGRLEIPLVDGGFKGRKLRRTDHREERSRIRLKLEERRRAIVGTAGNFRGKTVGIVYAEGLRQRNV